MTEYSDPEIDDDSLEIEIRPIGSVAARLVVLAAVCRRVYLEEVGGQDEEDDDDDGESDSTSPEMDRLDLIAWLADVGFAPEMSHSERSLLAAPVGAMPVEDVRNATWRSQALHALAWSVGLIDSIDPVAEIASVTDLLPRVPDAWDAPEAFRALLTLRSEDEIAVERERAELWRWRALAAQERRGLRGSEAWELDLVIKQAAHEADAANLIRRTESGDFEVGGIAFGALADESREVVGAVATERLRAFNLLCGFGPDWDSVPLDL
ncbi:MAG: DUF4272 domain-containing protein [Thermomicrobiales bacterium]